MELLGVLLGASGGILGASGCDLGHAQIAIDISTRLGSLRNPSMSPNEKVIAMSGPRRFVWEGRVKPREGFLLIWVATLSSHTN